MVAPRKTKKVFCSIVRIPETNERIECQSDRFSTRPSDLLPWADPYIVRMVGRLQEEVRRERRGANALFAELDPPSPATDADCDWSEETRWTLCDDAYSDFAD